MLINFLIDLPSPILVTSKRVKETSGRLTTPNRYQRWRGSMSNDSVPEVNLNKIKPISPDDHLLTPAKKEKPVVVDLETKTEKKKIAKPSEHLLTLTIANEHSKYVKPEDRVVEEEEDDIGKNIPQCPIDRINRDFHGIFLC